jgi:TolB-like protein
VTRAGLFRAALLGVCGVGASVRPARAQCPDGTPPPCARAARAVPATSVAVLYFDVRSSDPDDSALADGLTDAIIDELGANPRLTVASRFAVRRFRGVALPEPAALGRTLGAGSLVTGVLQRVAREVQVRVELVAAATGRQLWREPYEGGTQNALALQRDIAQRVAMSVGGQLAGGRAARLATPTSDTAAYGAYLRGNGLLPMRTLRTIRAAIGEYQRAVTLDPRLVSAWARIGIAYALRVQWLDPVAARDPDSLLAAGTRAADRAVALDPRSAEAWLARAFLLMYRNPRTLQGVQAAFDRTFALAPRYGEAWQQYADFLQLQGSPGREEALRKALEYEPARPITLTHLSMLVPDSMALVLVDSAIALAPTNPGYHERRAFLMAGFRHDTASAARDLETCVALYRADGRDPWEPEVWLSLLRGDSAAARATVRAALARNRNAAVLHLGEAWPLAQQALGVLDDREAAIDVLRRIRPLGVGLYRTLARLPAPLRTDPRVQELMDASRPPWEVVR